MSYPQEMKSIKNCMMHLMDQGTTPRASKVTLVTLLLGMGRSDLISGINDFAKEVLSEWIDQSELKMKTYADCEKYESIVRQAEIHKRVTNLGG